MKTHTTEETLERIDNPNAPPDIRILAVADEIQRLVQEGVLTNLPWDTAARLQGLPLVLMSVASDLRLNATPRSCWQARALRFLARAIRRIQWALIRATHSGPSRH